MTDLSKVWDKTGVTISTYDYKKYKLIMAADTTGYPNCYYIDMENFLVSIHPDFRTTPKIHLKRTRDLTLIEILFFNMHYYPLVRNTDEGQNNL